jgi:FtsP/CotA-like multicopper oxidase with cupredoxin domain
VRFHDLASGTKIVLTEPGRRAHCWYSDGKDTAAKYVWHCDMSKHEDNEMMRAYIITAA